MSVLLRRALCHAIGHEAALLMPAGAVATAWPSQQACQQPHQRQPHLQQRERWASTSSTPAKGGKAKPWPAQEASAEQLARAAATYQRSRLGSFYDAHLARELLLKLDLPAVNGLPRIRALDLSITAKDLHGRRYAEKWEMLLPALALEYITGQPADFVISKLKYYRSRNAVTAVKVRVAGGAAYELLQKLTHIVLPSQAAFTGVPAKSVDLLGHLHFRVPKMIHFPDLEESYELFEALGACQVSVITAGGTRTRGRTALLLTGLQLPVLARKGTAAEGAAETAAADKSGDASSDDEV